MNFIAIIPARYASTRFEGKPLADIFGEPMIWRVYKRALDCFKYVVVATDDKRIEETVLSLGGNVVMTSNKHQSGTDRCYEALDKSEKLFGKKFDVVINIQGDEPFVCKEQLEKIKSCFNDTTTQIATLIKPFTKQEDIYNPNSPKVTISKNGRALYFSRSVIPYIRGEEATNWQKNHIFYKHIGLYGYKCDTLAHICSLEQGELEKAESLEQLRWLENGLTIQTAVVEQESHAIDTPEDLQKVLTLYKGML